MDGEGLVGRIVEVLVERILVGSAKAGERLRQDGLAYEFRGQPGDRARSVPQA